MKLWGWWRSKDPIITLTVKDETVWCEVNWPCVDQENLEKCCEIGTSVFKMVVFTISKDYRNAVKHAIALYGKNNKQHVIAAGVIASIEQFEKDYEGASQTKESEVKRPVVAASKAFKINNG